MEQGHGAHRPLQWDLQEQFSGDWKSDAITAGTFPLAKTRAALARMASGKAIGKIVIWGGGGT